MTAEIIKTETVEYLLCWVPRTYTDGYANGVKVADGSSLEAAGFVRAISPSPAVDAHREAEAWRAIDKWLLANKKTALIHIGPFGFGAGWFARAMRYETVLEDFGGDGDDKVTVLEALAKWCEGQI